MQAYIQEKTILTSLIFYKGSVKNVNNKYLEKICLKNNKILNNDVTDSRNEDLYLPKKDKIINQLLNTIIELCENLFKEKYIVDDLIWSQIHKKNESTNLHNHMDPNCFDKHKWSGVYYVKIPKNSGKIVFQYNEHKYSTKRYWYQAVEGDFLIFPSHLDHFVTKNLTNENRIVISFNINKK